MTGALGHLTVLGALFAALAGMGACVVSGVTGRQRFEVWGRNCAFAVLALVSFAVALMIGALVTHDFSVKYVADVGSRETPLYYTVISLWGALEGSILFWAWLLSMYTTAFLWINRDIFPQIRLYATGILLFISSFFLSVIAGPGDPFAPISPVPSDGAGPNLLLQNHWMMGVHPPLLYLGYVGLSVPFAIGMSALLARTSSIEVLRLVRRWALVPWIFLSLGITAGMWWAYAVLGWGGYWAWDPVENASLMPWLVTTAFLHSLQVQERRRMLKTWTMALIVAAFLLSILGTFLTRSGVLVSVHSFSQSGIGPLFLAFFATVLIGSIALLVARSGDLQSPGSLDATVCRETVFLMNNLFLVVATFTVLLGTLFPLIGEAVQGSTLAVGAPYFNSVTVPIGFTLFFLMGLGPLLPWGAAKMDDLQYRLLPPVVAGVGTIAVLLVVGVRGIGALVTFGLAGFVLTVTIGRIVQDARVRHRNTGESARATTGRLVAANPRRYGGYLAHLGMVLVVTGIAASQSYGLRATVTLHPGQSVSLGGYTMTYRTFNVRPETNRMRFEAQMRVRRDGTAIGTLAPAVNYYNGQPVVTPAVREQPFEMFTGLLQGRSPLPDLAAVTHGQNPFADLYLVLQGFDATNANQHNARRAVILQVLVNPLVGLIWLGGIVTGCGGLVALLPARRRKRVEAPMPEKVRIQPEEVRA